MKYPWFSVLTKQPSYNMKIISFKQLLSFLSLSVCSLGKKESSGVTVSKYGRFLSKEVIQLFNYVFLCVEKLHYESGSQVKPLLSSCQSLGYIVLSKTAELNQLLNLYIRTDCSKSVKIMKLILFYRINKGNNTC